MKPPAPKITTTASPALSLILASCIREKITDEPLGGKPPEGMKSSIEDYACQLIKYMCAFETAVWATLAVNWVETIFGPGWFTLLHLYGPLEPWFDKSWKSDDFEPTTCWRSSSQYPSSPGGSP